MCAGSFPAASLANVWSVDRSSGETLKLISNDIDVYYGKFGEGVIQRGNCSYVKLNGLEKDVNLISCVNLNATKLIETCDINAVAVVVYIKVKNKRIASAEWIVAAQN